MGQFGEARYGVVLLLIVATVVVTAASSGRSWAYVAIVALQALTLVACLHAADARPAAQWLAAAVALLAVLSVAGSRIGAGDDPTGFARIVNAGLVGIAPVVIARDLWRRPTVTARTIAGALCIYLLLGMLYATGYGIVDAFSGDPALRGPGGGSEADRLYFSFITMTTTGYGDFTPAPGAPRAIAVLEALSGQIYLVTVIALLVGRFTPRRTREG